MHNNGSRRQDTNGLTDNSALMQLSLCLVSQVSAQFEHIPQCLVSTQSHHDIA